tara:strand:- start:17942 stop:18493 length:552 start_codon:yes stop_codon:yes gene_type:complete
MKWFYASAGVILGISHLGMIGIIANKSTLPTLNPPVGPYSSYSAEVKKDGYRITYKGNDPKVMAENTFIDKTNGFFGIGGESTIRKENQYTMDGARHTGGGAVGKSVLTAKKIECIKAAGGGEQTGAVIGASIGTAAAPALSGIPFVGPVLAGGVALFAGNKGGDIGGEIAQQLADCEEEMLE